MPSKTWNTIDKYRGWELDLIRKDVKKNTFPYAVCMVNIEGDFNFGTLVRNSNAFGASKVFYFGKKKWDRRSAVGTHLYTDVVHLTEYDELFSLKEKYAFVAVENTPNAQLINDFAWSINSLMIFGSENEGVPAEILAKCESTVIIEQFGSVRSLNVGCASAIAMQDYTRKNHGYQRG